jgi:hypothetical protein
MTVKTMKQTFKAIPKFKDIKLKNFECHPVLMNEKKVETLIENNFTYVSYGIQSLNEKIINGQNRYFYNLDKIKKQFEIFKKNDVVTNCDVLAFMETGTLKDLDTLKADLYKIHEKLNPDVITVYPMYQRLKINVSSYADINHNFRRIHGLRKVLIDFINNSSYNGTEGELSLDKKEIIKYQHNNYFLLNIPNKKYEEVRKYSSSGYPYHPANQNVLGLGGLYNHTPYSYLGRDKYWEMINDNWNLKIKEKTN